MCEDLPICVQVQGTAWHAYQAWIASRTIWDHSGQDEDCKVSDWTSPGSQTCPLPCFRHDINLRTSILLNPADLAPSGGMTAAVLATA